MSLLYEVLPKTQESLERVWKLTHDAYVEEGYAAQNPTGILRHYPELDFIPQTTVIGAFEDGALVGTNSLTLDSGVGLHVDHTFLDLVREIRVECFRLGFQLGASWRIATLPHYRGTVQVILGLIGTSVEVAVDLGLDVVLFSFNPRHAKIYMRLLDLEILCDPRPDPTVQGAPAILMRGEMDRIVRRWERRRRAA